MCVALLAGTDVRLFLPPRKLPRSKTIEPTRCSWNMLQNQLKRPQANPTNRQNFRGGCPLRGLGLSASGVGLSVSDVRRACPLWGGCVRFGVWFCPLHGWGSSASGGGVRFGYWVCLLRDAFVRLGGGVRQLRGWVCPLRVVGCWHVFACLVNLLSTQL